MIRPRRVLNAPYHAHLATRHPNLFAIKIGGFDTTSLSEILEAAPELRCCFVDYGYAAMHNQPESGLIAARSAGEPAWARAFHGARGTQLATMLDEAKAAHTVRKTHVIPTGAHRDGAFDKMNLKLSVPGFPRGLLPPPTPPPDESIFTQLIAELPADWLNRRPAPP